MNADFKMADEIVRLGDQEIGWKLEKQNINREILLGQIFSLKKAALYPTPTATSNPRNVRSHSALGSVEHRKLCAQQEKRIVGAEVERFEIPSSPFPWHGPDKQREGGHKTFKVELRSWCNIMMIKEWREHQSIYSKGICRRGILDIHPPSYCQGKL